MKNKLLKIFTAIFACATLALCLTACNNEHTHNYVETVTQPTCTSLGYTTHTCECGNSYVDSYVNATPHNYTQTVVNEYYLKEAATCTKKAVYCKSCTCGFASQTETFFYGNLSVTHTSDDSGWCIDCRNPVQATKGLIFKENGTYATIVDYTGESEQVNIPSTYNHLPVTSIGKNAFEDCKDLTTIIIPNSITTIADSAFDSCTSLTSVVIPDCVTTIGLGAFYNCTNLTHLTIPDSISNIGYRAFEGCSKLTYTITGNSKYLGNENNPYLYLASATSNNIKTPTIDTNCKLIGYKAFAYCNNLENIIIPDNIVFIGTFAFESCLNLKNIIIPSSVKFIAGDTFVGCNNLTYTIENSLKYLGNTNNPYLFLAGTVSTTITTATINKNCKFIGVYAFEDCSNLTSVSLPNGLCSISECSFFGCTRLKSLAIPYSVTFIGPHAFYGCNKLTVYCERENQPSGWAANWNNIIPDYCPVYWYREDNPNNFWHYGENGEIVVW